MTRTRKSYFQIVLTAGLAMSLLACNGNGNTQSAESTVGSSTETADPEPAKTTKKMDSKEQVAFSREDLAARLDVDPETVSLSGATPVTWRSGALGCPEPGMNYTQALVPGVWIMLRVGNTAYRYHATPGGQPFFCPDERAEPPVTNAGAD
jgi:hypothetical protein